MLLNATDDEGKKLSYRDIREEVDTFMFEVTKELIGLLFFCCCCCCFGRFHLLGFFVWFFPSKPKIQNFQVMTLVLVQEVAFSMLFKPWKPKRKISVFLFYRGGIEALVCPGKTLDKAHVVGPASVSRVYS